MKKQPAEKIILWAAIALAGAAALLGCQKGLRLALSRPPVPAIDGAVYVGTDTCALCHDQLYRHYRRNVHARLAPHELKGSLRGCESCHGPGSRHVESGGAVDTIIGFNRLSVLERAEICLQCHRRSATMDWRANMHEISGVGCTECHTMHSRSSASMTQPGDPDLCFTCHQEKKVRHMLPSRHPVREQKMTCGSCHNIHGSERHGLKKTEVNEVCLECHAEYQGPFVYEHAPVVEDCTLCHDAHGTVAVALLRQSEPFLCLRCHRGHAENPKTGQHPTAAALLTSCVQCHSQVHGSDLSSQLSTRGLTR